jgi:hypothetical protein
LEPRRIEIEPSEKVCFRAVGVDSSGCRKPVKPRWLAFQDGKQIHGLMSQAGCFFSGDNAAESEGLYTVSARYKGKSDSAKVFVAYPDITDLLAARLRPLDELLGEEEKKNTDTSLPKPPKRAGTKSEPKKTAGKAQPTFKPKPEIAKAGDNNWNWLIIAVIVVAITGAASVLLIYLRRKSRHYSETEDEFAKWLDEASSSGIRDDKPVSRSNEMRREGNKAVNKTANKTVCPKCGSLFPPEARFCPEDGSPLEIEPAELEEDRKSFSNNNGGKICPKCHRGYDMEAVFCPHDSERLIPYCEWRKNNKNNL